MQPKLIPEIETYGTGFTNSFAGITVWPSAAKAGILAGPNVTAEAVPYPKSVYEAGSFRLLGFVRSGVLSACFLLWAALSAAAEQPARGALELSRPVRSWEFLPIVGTRAGLFGNESGQMEAWVYPLKIFRDFRLTFYVDGRALPAESLVRTLIVHPESATLVYAGDNFSVRETFFVPVREPGAIILFDVETEQPLEIEASFVGDFAVGMAGGTGRNVPGVERSAARICFWGRAEEVLRAGRIAVGFRP